MDRAYTRANRPIGQAGVALPFRTRPHPLTGAILCVWGRGIETPPTCIEDADGSAFVFALSADGRRALGAARGPVTDKRPHERTMPHGLEARSGADSRLGH